MNNLNEQLTTIGAWIAQNRLLMLCACLLLLAALRAGRTEG